MIQLILACGIPSAFTGFLFWILKRQITKVEAKREKQQQTIEELMSCIMKTSHSTNVLAEATARAVQRIPDAHCNGDMTSALAEAARFQKEEKDFLLNQGIKHIFYKE